jgi:glycosyltransferase involved in cell wall biosynthesis
MNILYIGPYRQNDSWGQDSRKFIRSIKTTESKLSLIPVYYTDNILQTIDSFVPEAELSRYKSYDKIIQHGLPNSIAILKNKQIKNTAILKVETGGWNKSRNLLTLNKLDHIYVITETEKSWLEKSGVTTPITSISYPIDISDINNQQSKVNFAGALKKVFKFYAFCDMSERSNLELIIKAFHIAFNENDKVNLVLKIDNHDNNTKRIVEQLSEKIKRSLRINKVYRHDTVLVSNGSDENTNNAFHNSCDCFIDISLGNNFSVETVKAAILGKTPIIMDNTGLSSLLDSEISYHIRSHKTPVFLENSPLPQEYDLFTSDEYWYAPNLDSLISTMREAYKAKLNIKSEITKKYMDKFLYSHVGELLCN